MNFKISEFFGGTSVFLFFHLQYLYRFGPIKSYEVIMTLRYFVWTDLSLFEFLEDVFGEQTGESDQTLHIDGLIASLWLGKLEPFSVQVTNFLL